jgi:Uncharacterized protein conserved in bacteria (DUF2188)
MSARRNSSHNGKNGSQHVIPENGGWTVRIAGRKQSAGVYDTQAEAIEAARAIAGTKSSEIVIHGQDGRIDTVSHSPADDLMLRVWHDAYHPKSRPN